MKLLAVIDLDVGDWIAQVVATAGDILPLIVAIIAGGLVFRLVERWAGDGEMSEREQVESDGDDYDADVEHQRAYAEENDADQWFVEERGASDAPDDDWSGEEKPR